MALAAFASVFMGNPLEGGLLLAMFNLSHIAEEYFTSRSKVDVNELKENHPEFALLLDVNNGSLPSYSNLTYHEVPVSDLKVGSSILVKAGESVPVDCEVLKGSSTITVEHLTGEVKPLEKNVGDSIPGGARNLDGMLIVKAGTGGSKPFKASLGSVEYIASLYQSEDESTKIKEAVRTSTYGGDFVRAALSVNNNKVSILCGQITANNIPGIFFSFWLVRRVLHFCFQFVLMHLYFQIKQNVALALSSIAFASLTSVLGFLPLWLTVRLSSIIFSVLSYLFLLLGFNCL
nr:probable cadmium/zinc-transporting ATPase HMA1, chloroplastic [Ipomoea batatas]